MNLRQDFPNTCQWGGTQGGLARAWHHSLCKGTEPSTRTIMSNANMVQKEAPEHARRELSLQEAESASLRSFGVAGQVITANSCRQAGSDISSCG